jgi:hypothetical protein
MERAGSQSAGALPCAATSAERFVVGGMLAQGGTVSLGDSWREIFDAGTWTLDIPAGTYDLVATTGTESLSTAPHAVINRDVTINGATTLPAIDIDATGVALQERALSVTNVTSGVVDTGTFLVVDEGRAYAPISRATTETAHVLPASALQAGEVQWIYINATTQGADVRFTGSETSIALLPPLDEVTFTAATQVAASWPSIPIASYTSVTLNVNGRATNGDSLAQSLTASRGWLERNGDTSIAIDTSAPGYDPAWNFNPTAMHSLQLMVQAAEVNNISLWSGALQTHP